MLTQRDYELFSNYQDLWQHGCFDTTKSETCLAQQQPGSTTVSLDTYTDGRNGMIVQWNSNIDFSFFSFQLLQAETSGKLPEINYIETGF